MGKIDELSQFETVKLTGYMPAWDIEIDKKNWKFFPERKSFSGTTAKFKDLSIFHPPEIWNHPDPTYVQEHGREPCYQVEMSIKIIKKINPKKEEKDV